MKKSVLVAVLCISSFCLAESQKGVFTGEISDSQCANNVHSKSQSHTEMTATHAMGNSKADCVLTCVKKMGGKYVLLVPKGVVYNLDNQTAPEAFAGQQVKVKGTLDTASKTIKVDSIEAAK